MTALLLQKLTADLLPVAASFRCGDADLDEFIRCDAWPLQCARLGHTYLAVRGGELAGYVTLLADSIWVTDEELTTLQLGTVGHRNIPGIKIGRLATHEDHHGRGTGTLLMQLAFRKLLDASQSLGCRLLTVDAYPAAVPFYEGLGFVHNQHPSYQGKRRSNVSMRFDAAAPTLPDWTR